MSEPRFSIFSEVSVMIRDQEDYDALKEAYENRKAEFGDTHFVEFYDSKERTGGEVHMDWRLDIDGGPSPVTALWNYLTKQRKA